MFGVMDWSVPGLIWNRNWIAATLPGALIDELGTITTPPGNPPQLSGDRNWLCVRVRAQQRGNVWRIQQSWQLSAPHGWIPEMYQRA
jgi:hypothetical protein